MSSRPSAAEVLAEAATRRHANADASTSAVHLQEYEQRQLFRRLIDPGIVRPNSKEVAMDSLKTLSTIAGNILREPENTKYHTFKHENDTIKRKLIQPKGALEYALALGFRPKVKDLQTHYIFHPSRMGDLRIGAAMLKEALDRETDKEERQQKDWGRQKAAVAAVTQNVKLAFLDDRRRVTIRDQRERELRGARQSGSPSAPLALPSSPSPEPGSVHMPGPGYTLAAAVDQEGMDQPPPYRD